jgi:hypothetical protein
MEIGWIDVGTWGYILVSCAHSNTTFFRFFSAKLVHPPLFTGKLLIKFQNILRNTTQVHIKSNNSTTKVKIVKNERDSPLFTGKLLIKF